MTFTQHRLGPGSLFQVFRSNHPKFFTASVPELSRFQALIIIRLLFEHNIAHRAAQKKGKQIKIQVFGN